MPAERDRLLPEKFLVIARDSLFKLLRSSAFQDHRRSHPYKTSASLAAGKINPGYPGQFNRCEGVASK